MSQSEPEQYDPEGEAVLRATLRSVNDDRFVHHPDHQLVAVLEEPSQMSSLADDLASSGVGPEKIRVLYGPAGRAVLDVSGCRHGHWSHLVRTLQRLGYDENTLAGYDEALKNGHVVVHVEVPRSHVAPNVEVLRRHQLREIGYFGASSFEQFR